MEAERGSAFSAVRKSDHCPLCGSEKSRGALTCRSCWGSPPPRRRRSSGAALGEMSKLALAMSENGISDQGISALLVKLSERDE